MATRVLEIAAEYRRLPASQISVANTASARFQSVLSRTSASSESKSAMAEYMVRQGDTLSGICDTALRRQGRVPSGTEVSDAVQKIAKANGIGDVNRIAVGQKINLASLNSTSETCPALSRATTIITRNTSRHSDELTALIQSMIAKRTAAVAAKSTGKILDTPLDISSGFGVRPDPFTGVSEQHNGVDLCAASGTAIHPLDAGEVVFSGWQGGYGNTVIVQHPDGKQTLYAHNQTNLVKQGERVTSASQIAKVGSTGRATGPHVHFEVRKGGTAVDPTPYLRQASMVMAKSG